MEVRRQQGGGVMAFGLVQLGLAASSLGDATMSYEIVDWLANNYWFPSMMTSHDPRNIFNADLCGGLPAIIIKMLVYSQPGMIELLPVLPKEWPKGKIEGAPCRGQVLVKSLAWNPNSITVTLQSAKKQEVNLKVPGGIVSIKVTERQASISKPKTEDGSRIISLPAEREVTFEIITR